MAELAELGLRVTTNAGEAASELDKLKGSAAGAESAAENLGAGTRKAGGAIAAMIANIEKSVRAMEAHMAAATRASGASDRLAVSQDRLSTSYAAAYRTSTSYAASFNSVAAAQTTAAAAADKTTAAVGRASGANERLDQTSRTAAGGIQNLITKLQLMAGAAMASVTRSGGGAVQAIAAVDQVNQKAAKSSAHMTQATLNLSRQFADIGVTAAMGMNPLMILIQQGPQIADAFATAKAQGIGFNDMMGNMVKTVGPVAGLLTGIGIAAGVAFGGAYLAARAMNQENGNVAKNLGATAEEIKKLKEAGVEMETTMGDVFKGVASYIADLLQPQIKAVKGWWTETLDTMTKNTVNDLKVIGGAFAYAYEFAKTIWSKLPAVMGDIIASTTNAFLSGLEKMINMATSKIDALIAKANAAAKAVNLPVSIGSIGSVSLGRVQETNAGAAGSVYADAKAAGDRAAKQVAAGIDRTLGAMGKSIQKVTEARVKKDLDKLRDSDKKSGSKDGPAAPRDKSDERMAQLQQQIEAALAEELQARLGLVVEVSERAALERQIIDAQIAQKNAAITKQMADIADDKGLTAAKKAELTAQLKIVQETNNRIGDIRKQVVTRDEQEALRKQENAVVASGIENQIAILQSQAEIEKTETGRLKKSLEILDLQTQLERLKLQEIIESSKSTAAEKAIAAAKMATLDAVEKNKIEAMTGGLEGSMNRITSAFDRVAGAWSSKDWGALVKGIMESVDALKFAFRKGGSWADKLGGIAGVASGLGSMVGGKAGSVLSGIGSGISMGATIGSIIPGVGNVVGGIVGGVVGAIGGLFGGGGPSRKERRAEQQAAAAEKEAERQARIVQTAQAQEIELLELQGKSLEAVALQRKYELAGMDAANRARQEAVYALRDEVAALEKAREAAQKAVDEAQDRANKADVNMKLAREMEIALIEASGDAIGALNARRADDIKALDASLQPFQQALWAVEDAQNAATASAQEWAAKVQDAAERVSAAQDKLADAQNKLTDAYNNQKSAYEEQIASLQATIDRLKDFKKTMDDLKKSIITDDIGGGASYGATRSDFTRYAALAASGSTEGQEGLGSAISAFLAASRDTQSRTQYARDRAAALRAIEEAQEAAGSQIENQQSQIDLLNSQIQLLKDSVSQYIDLNEGVLTVAQATEGVRLAQAELAAAEANQTSIIAQQTAAQAGHAAAIVAAIQQAQAAQAAALAAAQAAQAEQNRLLQEAINAQKAAEAATPSAPAPGTALSGPSSWSAYVDMYADLKKAYESGQGYAEGRTKEEFGLFHYYQHGQGEGRQGVVPASLSGGTPSNDNGSAAALQQIADNTRDTKDMLTRQFLKGNG